MEKAPIHIAWQTTPKCNLKCVYCYANAGEDAKADVLSTSEAKKFILEASDLGVKSIVFTGGEPLTRSDILDLIEFTSDIGLKPILATNGTLLSDEFIKKLKEADASIAINLPTVSEEIHRRLTGASSSLKTKLSALEKCLKHGLKCSIGAAITKLNYKDIDTLLSYALEKDLYTDLLAVMPCGRARMEIIPTGLEYHSFLQRLWKKWRVVPMNAISCDSRISIYEPIYLALLAESEEGDWRRLCSIGETMHIMEDGSVRTCVFIPYTIGNVRKEGLNQIWKRLANDKLVVKLRDPEKLKGICRTCPFKMVCGGCRARAYLVKGDLFASDPVCWRTSDVF